MLSVEGDVTDSRSVDEGYAQAERELGPVDIVVSCAGTGGDSLHTADISDEEWRRVFAINADGVFHFNRAAARSMPARGYGRVVNVASIAGKEGNPMAAAYSASKAAVIGMTKSFGKDLADTGVLVNCIAPAVIATPILEQLSEEHVRVHGLAHPDGTHGSAGGGGRADRLPRERADVVLHRGDVRHQRRARDLLGRVGRARSSSAARADRPQAASKSISWKSVTSACQRSRTNATCSGCSL